MNKEEKQCKRIANLHFFPECNGNVRKGWILHHVDQTLRKEDPVRYKQWRIEDLVPMTAKDHTRMHCSGEGNPMFGKPSPRLGKHWNEEQRRDISERWKGNQYGAGHPRTSQQRDHLSEVNTGLHFYNNGIVCIRAHECPEGWVPGMLKKK